MTRTAMEPDIDLLVERLNGIAKDVLLEFFTSLRSGSEADALLFYLLTEGERKDIETRLRALFLLLFSETMGAPKKTLYVKAGINEAVFERMARCWRAGGRPKKQIYRIAAKHFPELSALRGKRPQ